MHSACRYRLFIVGFMTLILGCESAPSTPSIVIEPVIATTEDVLEAVLVTESVDSGGDEVSYAVSWFQDDSERTDLTDWAVPAVETSRGERWEVRVVASYGSLESGVAQAWVEINNSEPRFTSLSIAPEFPQTADSLELEYQVDDSDGDPVEVSFVWTVDDEETWHTESSIPAHATARGQTWRVHASVSDGTDQGASESALVSFKIVGKLTSKSMYYMY